eukprot:TRINITY_DN9643_c0_g1_i1.p1 TRINITY_DN9643_c0_g1~~TRINITY_DN9643_c0_g1_i1.p1  ORF type:complete len:166 (-),score=22.29 TRINITY_DN9643_c0_g1_i1:108-605(-)
MSAGENTALLGAGGGGVPPSPQQYQQPQYSTGYDPNCMQPPSPSVAPQYGYDPNYYGEGGYQQGPPPMVYPPEAYVPPPSTVIIQTIEYGESPQLVSCQYCGSQGFSETAPTPGLLTYLFAGGLCLCGCWLGCCFIPFCVRDLQDTEHRCRSCGRVVGIHKKIRT